MARTPPPRLSDGEIRALYRDGETVSNIIAKARRQNGLSASGTRAIIYGGSPS